MKKTLFAAVMAAVCLVVSGCRTAPESTPAASTVEPAVTATIPSTSVPGTTAAVPPETTQPPVLTGWQQENGSTYYYLRDGTRATGWLEIDGKRFYFGDNGAMCIGWLVSGNSIYYLGADGTMTTGWLDYEGKRYCFAESGKAYVGWQEDENGMKRYFQADGSLTVGWETIEYARYYFDQDGTMQTGWIDAEENRFYLDEDGKMVTGWLEQGEKLYYLRTDGTMARGCVEIDGVKNYFTSTGDHVILVNPWNYLPENFDPQLVTIQRYGAYNNLKISQECYDPLIQMLDDCKAAGHKTYIVSAYRTQEFQEKNYQRKVNYYLNLGYSEEDAKVLAAKVVAVPGTSEHQLGLALDIVDASWPYLEDAQADKPAQKWLMEHCWEYGFILRYPKDKTDVTGIIYEPWHYRYVGKELAAELHENGLTLEEYLDSLTQTE